MCTRRVHVHVHINSIILFSTPVFSPRQRHLFAFRFINQLAKTKNGEGGSFASLENWQKKHNHAFVHTYIFRVGKDRPSDCGLLDAKKKLTVPKGAPEGILSARYRYHRYYISTKDLRESTASSGEKKERKKKNNVESKANSGPNMADLLPSNEWLRDCLPDPWAFNGNDQTKQNPRQPGCSLSTDNSAHFSCPHSVTVTFLTVHPLPPTCAPRRALLTPSQYNELDGRWVWDCIFPPSRIVERDHQAMSSNEVLPITNVMPRHDFDHGPHIFYWRYEDLSYIVGICVYDSIFSIQMEMRSHRAMLANKELLDMYVQYMQERGPFVTLGMNSVSSGTASYSQSRDKLRKNLPPYFSNPDCRPVGKGLVKTRAG